MGSPLAKSNVIVIDIETSESRFGFAGDESTQVGYRIVGILIRLTYLPILYITPKQAQNGIRRRTLRCRLCQLLVNPNRGSRIER